MKNLLNIVIIGIFFISIIKAQTKLEQDTIKTAGGDLVITFIGHGTLMFNYDRKIIHVDPVGSFTDYSKLPKADIIAITHHHGDHFDVETIKKITKENTRVILTQTCNEQYGKGIVLRNGESEEIYGINIKAVPAYNIINKRSSGEPFHPKGMGNGYVLTFGEKHVYIAGDTENIPEMKNLSGIDIAFIPMNLPYTMTPEMAADAVNMLNPKILYPYHFGESNTDELVRLLKANKTTEIRIRHMK